MQRSCSRHVGKIETAKAVGEWVLLKWHPSPKISEVEPASPTAGQSGTRLFNFCLCQRAHVHNQAKKLTPQYGQQRSRRRTTWISTDSRRISINKYTATFCSLSVHYLALRPWLSVMIPSLFHVAKSAKVPSGWELRLRLILFRTYPAAGGLLF